LGPENNFSDSDGFEVLEHGEHGGETFRMIRQMQIGQTEHGSGPGLAPVAAIRRW